MREERKIFIGGLSADTVEKDLKKYFTQFGQVIEAQVSITEAIVLAIFVVVLALTAFFRRASLRAAFIPFTELTGEDQ